MATKTPSFIYPRGTEFLGRASNDTAFDPPSGGWSVVVTVNPNTFGAAQDGVIVAKRNLAGNQAGFAVEYISSTGMVRCRLYGNVNGSVYLEAFTNTAVRTRRSIMFSWSTANGMRVYRNGTLDTGTVNNVGSYTTPSTSTEPLSIAADSRTGTATNAWKGNIFMVALFNADVGGNTFSNTGVLPAPLSGHANIVAYWKHDTLTVDASNNFTGWVDTAGSRALTKYNSSGTNPLKAQAETGQVLTRNIWDANLTDQALQSTGLSTTYTLTSPYRIWGAAATEPQIASNYRSYESDITVLARVRKVTGRTSAVIIKTLGINLQFILSNKEMFIVLGTDTSNTLQNKRISWGFNLFPIEGTDAVVLIRYNADEKDADLFINQISYLGTKSTATTNASETTTGFFVSESCDFYNAAVHPGCLSDPQVDTFVLGLAQNAYGVQVPILGYVNYLNNPSDIVPPAYLAAPTFASTIDPINTAYLVPAPAVGYVGAQGTPKDISDPYDIDFDDPLPVVTVAAYSAGVLSVTGLAGPSNAFRTRVWWEIGIAGSETFVVGDNSYPRDVFTARNTLTDSFAIPAYVDLTGKSVVLVIQPQRNARILWKSTPFLIDSGTGGLTNPNPLITSAPIAVTGIMSVALNAGPTNAGTFTVIFQAEQTIAGNDWVQISPIYTVRNYTANNTQTYAFNVGATTGWTGKRIRAILTAESYTGVTYTSNLFTLSDFTYVTPAASVNSYAITPGRVVTVSGTAGPTDVGTCDIWWEIAITPGEFIAVLDKRLAVSISSATTISDSFTIPPNFSLAGKSLRLAIQPNAVRQTTHYSSVYSMTDATLTSPSPSISAAAKSLAGVLTASATLGVSNAGPATVYWEVTNDTGNWTSLVKPATGISLIAGQSYPLSYAMPPRLDLTGKNLRLVAQSSVVPEQYWYSASFPITQEVATTITPTVSSATISGLGAFTAVGSIPATNVGNVTYHFEALVSGDFQTIFELTTPVTTSLSVATAANAAVSIPSGLNLVGLTVRLVVRSVTFPELTWASSAFTITSVGATAPTPTVTTATLAANGVFTLAGTISASDAGLVTAWWEVDNIGAVEFDGKFAELVNVATVSGAVLSTSVNIPGRITLGGKNIVLKVQPAARPDLIYTSAPFAITNNPFIDPSVAVSAAAVSITGNFTATGAAGPSDIGTSQVWWEVEVQTNTFISLFDRKAGPNMLSARQTITANSSIPVRLDLTGKSVRLAVQQDSRPDSIYYSSLFALNVAQLTPPTVTITTAVVSISSVFTASATLSGVNNLGSVVTWWEVEVTTGEFVALFDKSAAFTLPTGTSTQTANSPLPSRFDLTGKSVRLAIQPQVRTDVVYYSSLFAITVDNVTDPAPTILSFAGNVWGDCAGSVRAGPTNAAFCDVWWEVILESGELKGTYDQRSNVNLFSAQTFNETFVLPRGVFGPDYNYLGRTVRVAVQPNNRPELIFYSSGTPLNLPARIDPLPLVTVVYPLAGVMVVQGQAGPTNMGDFTWWIELAYNDDIFIQTEEQATANLSGLLGVVKPIPIPFGWSFNDKQVRIAFSPLRDRTVTYYSPWYLLGSGFDNTGGGSAEAGDQGGGGLIAPLPKSTGIVRRRTRDFSGKHA